MLMADDRRTVASNLRKLTIENDMKITAVLKREGE